MPEEIAPNPPTSTNRKIVYVVLILCVIGFFWAFLSKTLSFYSGIKDGTIDFTQIAQNETSKLSNANASTTSAATVDNPRLTDFSQDATLGSPEAPVQIVMFADFECPFCRKVFAEVKSMLADHADDVYFVYRDFPIVDLHPGAQNDAEAAQCAHAQGAFWAYHDKLFLNGVGSYTIQDLKLFARQLNLNTTQFDQCLDTHEFESEVKKDIADGLSLGVTGTPTFFFNGNRVPGVVSKAGFDQIIEYLKNK